MLVGSHSIVSQPIPLKQGVCGCSGHIFHCELKSVISSSLVLLKVIIQVKEMASLGCGAKVETIVSGLTGAMFDGGIHFLELYHLSCVMGYYSRCIG